MKETFFPKEFIKKYKSFLGEEWDEFYAKIKQKQPKSFWINTNKASVKKTKQKLEEKNIVFRKYSFSNQAFFIDYKKPGDLQLAKQGFISMQEKASMMPVVALNPSNKDYVLDACAAPGMKTIQLSNFSKKVLATDVNSTRTKSLIHNKFLFGLKNVEVRRTDVRNVRDCFDKIMLDAPCSSEGLVRKRREALKGWSEKLVLRKAKVQKDLLISCFDMLKKKGEIVYATCSFAKEENEDVVNFLLDKREEAKTVPVKLEGVKIRKNDFCENCVRLYPQDNDTQQFFFAKIRKTK